MAPVERRQAIIDALPGTVAEIVERAKVSRRTVVKWIGILRAAPRIVRICGWRRTPSSGPHVPVYGLGSAKDAPCRLKPISNKERYRRFKARMTDDQYDKLRQQWIARCWRERAQKKGNAFELQNLFFAKPEPPP